MKRLDVKSLMDSEKKTNKVYIINKSDRKIIVDFIPSSLKFKKVQGYKF